MDYKEFCSWLEGYLEDKRTVKPQQLSIIEAKMNEVLPKKVKVKEQKLSLGVVHQDDIY